MKVNLKKGISLTEIAIILLVIGLVMAMIMSYMQSVVQAKRIADLNNDIEQLSQKIVNYTIVNGRLPDSPAYDSFATFKPEHDITYKHEGTLVSEELNRVNSICALPTPPNSQTQAYTLEGKSAKVRKTNTNQFYKRVTLNELKNMIGCDVATNHLIISTSALPRVSLKSAYSADIRATGGRPDYAWCAEIDEDIGGIKSANASLFKNCTAPATWNKTPSVKITFPALPKDTLAQSRIITFYVTDGNQNITKRKLMLLIDNY